MAAGLSAASAREVRGIESLINNQLAIGSTENEKHE